MKVVCIIEHYDNLTIGRVYDADDIDGSNNISKLFKKLDGFYRLVNDIGNEWWYEKDYFMSLKEYRRMKLEKLGSRL